MKNVGLIGLIALSGTLGLSGTAAANLADAAGEATRTQGKIDAVTVYRGQALVTRVVDLELATGLHEIVVTDLPAHIVRGSMHAEGNAGVVIRSVRYREQPVRADVREDVEALNDRLSELQDESARLARRLETLTRQKAYIERLEQFTATNAMSELSKGVLDAGTLKELSEYIFQQHDTIAEAEIELRFETDRNKEEIELLRREQNALGARSTRTARDAVITVDIRDNGRTSLDLRYLVNRATWEPSHTVRGNIEQETMLSEYFASIEQTSGEDWGDINMHLSTATPSLVARAPQLASLQLQLRPLAQARPQSSEQSRSALAQSQIVFEQSRANRADVFANSKSAADNFADLDMSLNTVARSFQLLELQGSSDLVLTDSGDSSEGHSVTYTVSGRTNLPSRPERQLIQISSTEMTGDFYKIAVPVLTSYVYEEAKVRNRAPSVLLAGPVTTYAGGQFVGNSMFDDIAIGEEILVGLGINSDLRSAREVIDHSEEVQGGNRVVTLTYRLSVENFGEQETSVRLMDRLPLVDPSEIRLTILNDGSSENELVQSFSNKQDDGIMTWNITVPARSIGDEAAAVEYTVRLEYDRQMGLVSTGQ